MTGLTFIPDEVSGKRLQLIKSSYLKSPLWPCCGTEQTRVRPSDGQQELLGGTNCGRGNRWDVLAQIILPSSLDWGGRYLPANGPSTLIVHPDMNRAC